jgi:hypothetical protein
MSFFSKPFKNLFGNPLKFVQNSLPTIGAVLGSLSPLGPGVGTAVGAEIGGTVKGVTQGQSLGSSAKNAVPGAIGSYVGGQIGDFAGNQLGGTLGRTVGDVTAANTGVNLGQSVAGDSIGNWIGNVAPSIGMGIGKASIGSVLGGGLGMSAANSMQSHAPMPTMGLTGPTPFKPKQQDEQTLPASLTGLGSLTDQQKSSNLANQGVYGGGNGPQEQSYFMNLLNRRLVDQGGNTSDLSKVNPIEQSYLSKLGLSGYGNTNSLLEAMSKWSPA